ncbi:MAG: hypothetical protein Q8927_12090 [Bacteroidota bacterium]|nr:hypothetical protein [Bacteroidota bacterium]MDP4216932.1 hypothetical protein [Bacteroidota bacterium]MDP4245754.1 hypothetical protein [Bacteroidota bacterium]MDP4255498.1 hypothetical protein [Bacteroidota bacterium]MDP4257102.1 hypothetical protein [Bacteroidota bacterium]
MKKSTSFSLLLIAFAAMVSFPAYSQARCSLLQAANPMAMTPASSATSWFGFMELPFLFISVFFAFLTANSLKGGKFGKGMKLMAWGFLVMAVGHLHMQIEHFYGYNLFQSLLGQTFGRVAWFLALILTWGLTGLGFYSIYKSSKGE